MPPDQQVSGQLVVDLTDITWQHHDVARTIAHRFWAIHNAPVGADVIVRLPRTGHDLPLIHAFAGWDRPPGRLRFHVEGPDSRQIRSGCDALRAAIDAANQPLGATG